MAWAQFICGEGPPGSSVAVIMCSTSIFFMQTDKQILLQQRIEALPFSKELIELCTNNNIATLENLLDIEIHKWHKLFIGFSYHHQHEIVSYLQAHDLEEFIREN